MPIRHFLFWTLSLAWLGVLFSCAQNTPEEPFPQDRNVGGFVVPLEPRRAEGLSDSLSGWYLRWNPPLSTSGLTSYYLFEDSLGDSASIARLINGVHELDLSGLPPCHILPVGDPESDTAWEIPAKLLGGKQRLEVSRGRHWRFTLWARYNDGPIGKVVTYHFFLGDDIPPSLPTAAEIGDSIFGTRIVLDIPRPGDFTSRLDTTGKGPLGRLQLIYWQGDYQLDSLGKEVRRLEVPPDQLADTARKSFRMVLSPLRYFTRYTVVLEVTDSVGNVARSPQLTYSTRDSLRPASVTDLSASGFGRSFKLGWNAATDTFDGSGNPLAQAYPNYRIAGYRVYLDGVGIDSILFRPDQADQYSRGKASEPIDRFQWNGSRWTWSWSNLRPGKPYRLRVEAVDRSGNTDSLPPQWEGIAPKADTTSCPAGFVPVSGSGRLHRFCIQEHEYDSAGIARARVSWAEAVEACQGLGTGIELCSEAQWVRACETAPEGDQTFPYGAMEVGGGGDPDSLAWLKEHCQLGTGDSSTLGRLANADPRCVSAWGVYDLPGRLGEWTLDVFRTNQDSTQLDSGNLAYRGVSDLTGSANLGTVKGGSALVLQEPALALASARCRARNYPAFSTFDTLKTQGMIRRTPNPLGRSLGWGFRCCMTF